jgi:very-short-patch-repair endonuclease
MIPENIKTIAIKLRNNQNKSYGMRLIMINYDLEYLGKKYSMFIQKIICKRYIISDFYIAKKKLIIEID